MKALVTGADGQLGRALIASAGDIDVSACTRPDLDITDAAAVRDRIGADRPDVVVNAAAYTAVDRAESESDLAMKVNGAAVARLGAAASQVGARLVQISTDFVFDGNADRPYLPSDDPHPLSAYGRSKLAGEEAALAAGGVVVRTSRVYAHPGANFVSTMLGLMASRDEVRVVDDQVGTPTWARTLAETVWQVARDRKSTGIWHWTDGGACTWHEWAVAIQEGALERGLLQDAVLILPVTTDEFPTPARRPALSVLDCSATVERFEVEQVGWRVALGTMLDGMAAATPNP